jgi:hypothetical protein
MLFNSNDEYCVTRGFHLAPAAGFKPLIFVSLVDCSTNRATVAAGQDTIFLTFVLFFFLSPKDVLSTDG